MFTSIYREPKRSIQLVKEFSGCFSIYYVPSPKKKERIELAYFNTFSDGEMNIVFISDRILEVHGDEQEVTQYLCLKTNKALREMKVKLPAMSLGFYKNCFNGKDFRIHYYDKHKRAYVISDSYTNIKDKEPSFYSAVGVQLKRYITPRYYFKSYEDTYWSDVNCYINGIHYFKERSITSTVACDLLLHQIEHGIPISCYLKSKLDDEDRRTVDTAITLLKLKEGVA